MDEIELIRRLRDDTPDAAARESALSALRERSDGPAPEPSRLWRSRPRRRWLAAPAVIAAVAGIMLLITGGDDTAIAPAPAAAREALGRAADAAESRPERLRSATDYFYTRERTAYLAVDPGAGDGSWSVVVPREREEWTSRRGGVRISEREVGPVTYPGPRDRRRAEQQGDPQSQPDPDEPPEVERLDKGAFVVGGSSLTYEQLKSLPSDGHAMYRRLVALAEDAGASPDEEAFTIIGDLLRSAPVPARARAGLYRAAAYIKGVRSAGEVRDKLGRRGLAVELTVDGERHRLIFDPDTSQLLFEETVLTKRNPTLDADPGFVTGYRLVVEQGVVKSDTARP